MQVKRAYGKQQKTILCNVPPMLPGELFSQNSDIKAVPSIELGFGDFSIATFMARYLAGYQSLKSARSISRKRLALVASSVRYFDAQAYELHQQIQRYLLAKNTLIKTTHHTVESILALNHHIAPESKSAGTLRQGQNWVGGKTVFEARYVCPPPELVPELFENWLGFINDTAPDIERTAIVGHCQLVSIHPFFEGNGRTARVLMDGLLAKAYGDRVPLLIYRLSPSCPPDAYIEAQELLNVGDPKGLSHSFWPDAFAWTDKLQHRLVEILTSTKQKIQTKIALAMLSADSITLLNHLWQQPIVCQRGLLPLFDMNINQIRIAINELVKLGILETRKLREPANAVIYDCPIIFAAYTAMDEAIATIGVHK